MAERSLLDTNQNTLEDKPAVGFISRADNTDALVRSLLQAKLSGFRCLVTYDGESPTEGAMLAKRLDCSVIRPSNPELDEDALQQLLVGAARATTESGIILAPLNCEPINYDRSSANLSDERFVTEAVTQSQSNARQRPKILVGIPAYNEAKTIGDVVAEAKKYADEVLVVDDGSDDETVNIARNAGADVYEHGRNKGYGNAMKTIFSIADQRDVQSLVTLDADGQHDPSEIPKLVERLDGSDAKVVIGSRFVDGSDSELPLYRFVGIKIINLLTNLSLGAVRRESWVSDTQCGLRVYSSVAIQSIANDKTISHGMGASTDILHHAHRSGYEIVEVGATVSYNVDSANSHNPVRHGLKLLTNLLTTIESQRPLTTLGFPGFVLTFTGFLLGYWSLINATSVETIPVGILTLAVASSLLGILFCFTALVFHSLTVYFATQHK